ncbi:MAG: hypothetical protein A3D87_03525 [Omnitrophica WOR_2 bacterium RIFCSPHIGHO2_02_FULL_50_17]|nr:MAG: hypothetical protein A3D87_03525 [Omnitrophica WOR_2 bacterium RIFCSPHIGHO2_02_FULL_50_17]
MKTKCRVGIIGAGRMACFHLDVLLKMNDVEVVALANQWSEERRNAVCRKYNIPRNYSSFLEMLDQEALDAVFICVSVMDNFTVARSCLVRGIPSLIEKPPGLSVEETEELLQIAEFKGVIHMVGLQRRFSSTVMEGIRMIRQRSPLMSLVVEAPERFEEIKAKKKFPQEVLRRWIFNNGIHCLDMLSFLGGHIKEFHVMQQTWKEPLHPDCLHALIRFEQGAIGHYLSNWNSPGNWAVRLFGDGWRLDIEPMEEGRVTFSDGTQQALPISQEDRDFKPGLFAQNRMFIDACLDKKKIGFPGATLREALVSMQLAECLLSGALPCRAEGGVVK